MKTLVLTYSQTGQTKDIVEHFVAGLSQKENIEFIWKEIKIERNFHFPWTLIPFLKVFTGSVLMSKNKIEPIDARDFDLIILGYQVWFLSPSIPISSLMQSDDFIVKENTPFIALCSCRNMWYQAHKNILNLIHRKKGRVAFYHAYFDKNTTFATLFSTPLWLFTGTKGPFLGGLIPKAGLKDYDYKQAFCHGEEFDLSARYPSSVPFNFTIYSIEAIGKRLFIFYASVFNFIEKKLPFLLEPFLILFLINLILGIMILIPSCSVICFALKIIFPNWVNAFSKEEKEPVYS